jgi:regulator of sigma E protease
MGHAIVSWRKGVGFRRGSSEAEYTKMMRDWLIAQEPAGTETEKKVYKSADYDRAAAALGLSETEYRINWLPLGGYVKMLGQEDNDPSARSDDPRAFTSKSIGARAAVLSAGVIMNLIFGVIFFMIAFMLGVGFNAPIAGEVSGPSADAYAVGHENNPDYKGIRTDDRILTFNDEPVGDMPEVRINTALYEAGQPIKLGVERIVDGKPVQLTFNVTPVKIPAGLLDLGINIPVTPVLHSEWASDELMPLLMRAGVSREQAAKVRGGMRIIEAGGKPIERFHEHEKIVEAAQGKPVELVLEDAQVAEGQTKQRVTIHVTAMPGLLPRAGEPATRQLLGLVPAVTVSGMEDGSPAKEAGLEPGDVVVQIGAVRWPTMSGLVKVVYENGNEPLKLVVLRGSEEKTFEIKPRGGKLGIAMSADKAYISETIADSPGAKLSLPAGSRITGINGTPVATFADMQLALNALAKANPKGFEVDITCEPNEGKTVEPLTSKLTFDEAAATELASTRWNAPLPPSLFVPEMVILKGETPGEAIGLGIKKTHQSMLQVYLTLLRVAQGSVHMKNFQGPVGIAHTGTKIAKQGFTYLIFFLGLISVNLAVMNFLPIPVVDGGHIVFLIIEKIKGSPVGPKVQEIALYAGLLLLVCMFLYVTYNDIVRLFGLA